MTVWMWIGAGVAAWLALAVLLAAAARVSPREGDPLAGLVLLLLRAYARFWQRLEVVGREHLAAVARSEGGTLIVANHTAGVDPVLLQAACPFEIRFIMAEDMRVGWMEPIWRYARAIFVERERSGNGGGGRGGAGFREALRHVKGGGVVGVFPEGRIEREPGRVKPFKGGAGMLASVTRARVLLVGIEGTPRAETAWGSLWRRGRARVTVLPATSAAELTGERRAEPEEAAEAMRRRLAEAMGWGLVEDEAAEEGG